MPRLWPSGGLWRHSDFLKLWSAETVSQFGTQVSLLAIPFVAVLVLDATTFEVAALGVVEFLPFMLFTLPAGVWVDRLRRRPILIAGDFARAALLVSIPAAYVLDVLTLGQLYVVGFLVGTCTVCFDVAYQSYLPSLVEREQIIDGNSKLEISRSAAQIGGPGLAGLLVQAVTAPYAILVDAVSFLGSGLFLLRIRRDEERPGIAVVDGEGTSLWTELKEGLRFVLGNPNLRAQAGCTATSNFFSNVGVRRPDRVPRAQARALRRGHRARALPRERRIADSRLHCDAHLGAVRDRAHDDRGGRLLWGPATLLIAFAPAGNAAIPFLVVAQLLSGSQWSSTTSSRSATGRRSAPRASRGA